MSETPDYPDPDADPDAEAPPPWLRHDAVIAAVVGAWAQDERDRRAARLLARVHRCAMAEVERSWRDPRRVPLLLPWTAAAMTQAQGRGWLD